MRTAARWPQRSWRVSPTTCCRTCASLRSQVIHNDYHLYNVLVAPDDHARIVGIIDFGDMLHAPLVGEVATAAAFHMAGNADPFEGPAQFVAAYHATLPLTDVEQEIVADLMATRHLVTALISEWRAARYPENRAYIMRHNPAAWEALSQMADLSRDAARDRLLAGIRTGAHSMKSSTTSTSTWSMPTSRDAPMSGPATAAMIARRDALLGPAYRLMYERPLHIVRGEGAWLFDPEGRRYLDAYNNVTSLGHCHPR